jgi:hypothetical protein
MVVNPLRKMMVVINYNQGCGVGKYPQKHTRGWRGWFGVFAGKMFKYNSLVTRGRCGVYWFIV